MPRPEIEARQLATVGVPDEKRVADCTDPRGVRFGLSNEIGSGSEEDRERTHRWADAFHAQRFDGVRYWIRHDLTQTRAACAVFHHAGAADWPVLERAELDDDLLERVRTVFGIDID